MSLQACADLLARGDHDRFRATMAAPLAARRVLLPLYAFNLEVSRAPWRSDTPPIAEMRLQFWRDVVAERVAGSAPRAHEVVTPLAAALPAAVAGPLDRLVAARRWDIYTDPFADDAEFDAYLEDTGATLAWVAAHALGAPAAAEAMVRDAGWAFGLAGYLRAVPALMAAGRVPLIDASPAGLRDLAGRGLARLARARAQRARLPASAAPALFAGFRTEPTLRAVLSDPGRVVADRLPQPGLGDSLRLAWVATTGRW